MQKSISKTKEAGMNYIPSLSTVDFDRVYRYNNPEALSFLNKPLGQRGIKKNTITSVFGAIKDGTTECISPIQVDIRNMNLYDGQNRLEAFKKAWEQGLTPQIKVIYTPYGTEQMIDIQCHTCWTQKDKLDYFTAHGDETVKRMIAFALSHKTTRSKGGISLAYTSAVLTPSRIRLNEDKETGHLNAEITDEDFTLGEQVITETETFFDIMQQPRNNWYETMCQEWRKLRSEKGVYSQMADLIGFKELCREGRNIIKGWQCSTSHKYWRQAFENIINVVYKAVTVS